MLSSSAPPPEPLGRSTGLPADTGLPPCPPAELDPYIDAAIECFLRFGVRKTSVQDVARILAVNRATVYRQVGNLDSLMKLVLAREVHRYLEQAYARVPIDQLTPQDLVRLLVEMIRLMREHPVVAKVQHDEPELVGAVVQRATSLFAEVADLITPALRLAIASGQIADLEPSTIAQWLARISITVLLSPPPGDLEAFLAEMLVPALSPTEPRG